MVSYVDPIEYYDAIDLTQNALMNAAIHPLAAPPASPVQGQVYFDTVKKQLGQYDGTQWIYYGSASGVYKGTSATFVGLPTGNNGDWALLTTDVVGTGSVAVPQYPKGIYSLVSNVWTLQQNLSASAAPVGLYKGNAATFAALPTGAANGDWALLTATDGANPRGIYSLVAGTWTLQQNLASVSIVGLYKGFAATFAALPTVGVSDGDWSILSAQDGTNAPGIYDRVAGAWVLRQSLAPTVGVYRGNGATFATLPATGANGDWAILTASDTGTGTASAPQYPLGIYSLVAGVWTLEKSLANSLGGLYKGSYTDQSALPTAVLDGDWAIAEGPLVGTGTTQNPQFPAGLYVRKAGAWVYEADIRDTIAGLYVGEAATYATMPVGKNGDWGLLTANDIGTGSAIAPEHPRGIYSLVAGAWTLQQSLVSSGSGGVTAWAASSVVTAGELRSMAMADNTIVYMMSNSARTTGATLDVAELGEWTYLGQSIVGAFPPSESVIKGYQISESGAFYQSDTTRLTAATFDDAEQTVWGGKSNPPVGLYKGTSGTFAGLPATTDAQDGDWALLVNNDIGTGTAIAPQYFRGIYSLIAGVWTLHQSLASTVSGVYKSTGATFATLPTGATTGDWALLTADDIGTGSALNPQYPLGIYAYDGTNWVLAQKLSVGAGITFTPVADNSTLTAKTYSTAEPGNSIVQHFTAPAVTANSWFAVANTGLGVMDVDISGVHTQITANGGALWTANAAGNAWVMIDALQPTVQKEIGIGSALPTNNTTYSFFNLIGHASLPDSFYFWNNNITTWVQV